MFAAGLTLAPVDARIGPRQDATTVLAAARAALGGDALLNSITSFTVNGTSTEDLGRVHVGKSVEISAQLPDKYLMMTRRTVYGPPGVSDLDYTSTRYEGFNAGTLLAWSTSSGGFTPPFIPSSAAPKTPDELQAIAARRLRLQKEAFARLMLPLFAAAPAALPLQFETGAQVTIEKTRADVVLARTADGTVFTLYVDATTHLPVKLAWMAEPIVTMTTTSTMVTASRGGRMAPSPPSPRMPSAPVLPPPPPGSLTPVEWAVTFSGYKTDAGLTWPRRFVTTIGGKKREEMRLGKYKINAPIKPDVFEPKR